MTLQELRREAQQINKTKQEKVFYFILYYNYVCLSPSIQLFKSGKLKINFYSIAFSQSLHIKFQLSSHWLNINNTESNFIAECKKKRDATQNTADVLSENLKESPTRSLSKVVYENSYTKPTKVFISFW